MAIRLPVLVAGVTSDALMKKRSPLLALSSAALSLPAFSATQPVQSEVSLRSSVYDEGDAPEHRILSGDDDRYEIDINQFRLLTPIGNNWSFAVNASKEIMSGASPWGTFMGAAGEPSLIMSGATIHESRTEVSVTATHYQEDSSIAVAITHSEEDDYDADAITISGEWDFNNKLSTLSVGMSYSSDDIEPTDAIIFGRVQKEDKQSRSLAVGWAQVLNKTAVLHTGISVTSHDGYLTDPYKLRDVRPDDRLEWALSLRYRKFFDNRNAALHLDYRYYHDDFGIDSHTLQTAWYQNITPEFKLVPNIRWYSQSSADFYVEVDDFSQPLTTYQSSDYRLSSYGAYTFGLKAIYDRTNWAATVSVDRYISSDSYGHTSDAFEHPALLNFTLASIGFDFRF